MKKILLLFLSIVSTGASYFINANNLNITNATVAGRTISFDISWDNSWYMSTPPSNRDAVWVFVKYRECTSNVWQHADLSTITTDHSIGGGVLQIDTVSDGKGVFIRRSAAGQGNITTTTATVRLHPSFPAGDFTFKVFGIEMVYVPSGDFQIGDGNSTGTFNSITITSEASVSVGGNSTVDPIPAAYPKGWDALYCMKYEITQEQYVQFLNTLTYDQQASRMVGNPSDVRFTFALITTTFPERNYIQIDTPGVASTTPAVFGCNMDGYRGSTTGPFDATMNESNDGQNVACNFLSWYDLIAYLDWAALRPMTDIEFEKICRGPAERQAKVYVWGSMARSTISTNDITNSGESGEVSTVSGGGLAVAWDNFGTNGPLRVGIAATSTTDRLQSGATYWGALDMGGNVWERIVSTDANGKLFTGTLGDGILDASGNATNALWPGVSVASGWGRRGGAWESSNYDFLQISYRGYSGSNDGARDQEYGGRGVRDW